MARGDQLSRQWRIIQTLMASRYGKSAADLANALECTKRTVYRDLEALQMAGFPLFTEKGEGKTLWTLIDQDKYQPPLPLSLTELMALYLSRNMLKILQGTAIHDSLNSLFEKVKSMLPPDYIAYLGKIENSFEVGIKAYKPYQKMQEILTLVNEAIPAQKIIKIDYFTMSRNASTQRQVAPYKIWFYDKTFYLIGYCRLRKAVRLFAVDRIERIRVLQETFTAPTGFEADTYMHDSFGVFQGEPVSVAIRFAPEAAGYVQEKIWHPSQKLEPQRDGGLIFRAQVAGIEEIKFWVLKWGAVAQVIAPEALRLAVVQEARAMLGNYTNAVK